MQRKRKLLSKNIKRISISKRQQFIIAVGFLSLGFFLAENTFSHLSFYLSFYLALSLAVLSDLLLFWSLRKDLKDNFSWQIFILPFFYSLSFGLFYFLVPARYLTRALMTSLYALGLYSLLLSQNIFTVSSIRTIALLSGARTVSFIITIVSYFFLIDILLSLHRSLILTTVIFVLFTFPIAMQSIWTYSLEKKISTDATWAGTITLCLSEIFIVVWFWAGSPTVLALFLVGLFYTLVGLSHAWLEKRLFRSVIWEYTWVAIIVFFVLFIFSSSK